MRGTREGAAWVRFPGGPMACEAAAMGTRRGISPKRVAKEGERARRDATPPRP